MSNNVAISVIVPAYNVERYLEKCIDSILAQTFTDYELILIDDGSTDKSGEICDEYLLKNHRIKVLHNANGGVSTARNEGIRLAGGKYISFVDADDTVDSDCFEKLILAAAEKDYDFAICGFKKIRKPSKNKEAVVYQYCYDLTGSIEEFLSCIPQYIDNALLQGPCNKLFKTQIIKEYNLLFPLDMNFGEDTVFVYKYLLHTKNVASIKDCLYNYRQLKSQTLSSRFREDKLDIYLLLFRELNNLLNNYNVDLNKEKDYLIEQYKCGAFVSCTRELFVAKPKLDRKQRLEQIKKMISNTDIRNAFNLCKNSQKQTKILYNLIIKENIGTIYLYFMVKELIRAKCKWLYGIIGRLNSMRVQYGSK